MEKFGLTADAYLQEKFDSDPSLKRKMDEALELIHSFEYHGKREKTERPRVEWQPIAPVVLPSVTFPLNSEQQEIADAIIANKHDYHCVFGPAGVGKSVLLKSVFFALKTRYTARGEVEVVAPTGIAACNLGIGANTIHSFAFASLGQGEVIDVVNLVLTKKKVLPRWRKCKVLLVDEISMISSYLLTRVDAVARAVRGINKPFGGIKMVFFGDFLQLPPVAVDRYLWAFQSTVWNEMFHDKGNRGRLSLMTTVQRQQGADAAEFIGHLHAIRLGTPSDATMDAINSCVKPLDITNGILPTKLYCRNVDVDDENNRELALLPSAMKTMTAFDVGPLPGEQLSFFLDQGTPVPREVQLKEGAQVVLLKNIDCKKGLVNGARGVVVTFDRHGNPVVQFESQKEPIVVSQAEFTCAVPGHDQEALRCQIPLKLAWALTVHRAQGMTLDKVQINVADAFACGQVYVALSRVKSFQGLQVNEKLSKSNIKADRAVLQYYNSIATH